jgi:hypothetical protein
LAWFASEYELYVYDVNTGERKTVWKFVKTTKKKQDLPSSEQEHMSIVCVTEIWLPALSQSLPNSQLLVSLRAPSLRSTNGTVESDGSFASGELWLLDIHTNSTLAIIECPFVVTVIKPLPVYHPPTALATTSILNEFSYCVALGTKGAHVLICDFSFIKLAPVSSTQPVLSSPLAPTPYSSANFDTGQNASQFTFSRPIPQYYQLRNITKLWQTGAYNAEAFTLAHNWQQSSQYWHIPYLSLDHKYVSHCDV